MKVEKIQEGVYRVTDSQGVWIAKGGYATANNKWTAFECNKVEDCSNENNWAVSFDTFKQLKQYAKIN
tara:strand:+ start:269 stop:472 length:204 start_codon:yes stop_codon:yes gene_type:complete